MSDDEAETKAEAERAEVREQVELRRSDYEPGGTDLRTGAWPTLKKAALEFNEDHMTDWAAALTYYGLLALFPALIALVSIVGIFGDPETTTRSITDIVTQIGPESAADTFSGPIQSITENRSAAGIMELSTYSTFTGSVSSVMPNRRASRNTCVSTGKPGRPRATDRTTLAVLRPTPGNVTRSSTAPGTSPS